MSQRGIDKDNAVAERFFSSLKREHIRRRGHISHEKAWQNVFDYVEMFYNTACKQVWNRMRSPAKSERQQILTAEGVQKIRGYSGFVFRLNDFRRIASRHNKLAQHVLVMFQLAPMRLWLRVVSVRISRRAPS